MTDIQTTETTKNNPDNHPPAFGQIVLPTSGNPLDLPVPTAPYYPIFRQGTFLHRPLVFGHGIVPHHKPLKRLAEFENAKGWFWFEGPRLSAKIINQAISFFRRILHDKNSEAEVLITQDQATGEHRLFIPIQRVSKGSVHSIYNPEHIAPNHLVIGTIHSHCDFHAGHSGIDEADARDMDGIHLTIGMLQNNPPEIVAMVAMNKVFFHYDPEILADLTPTDDTAPTWWDRYVYANNTLTDDLRPTWANDEDWDKVMGRSKKITVVNTHTGSRWTPPATKTTPAKTETTHIPRKSEYDGNEMTIAEMQRLADAGWYWDVNQQNFVHVSDHYHLSEDLLPGGPRIDDDDDDDNYSIDFLQDYWEDSLGSEFIDLLFNTGLLTDDDTDKAIADFPLSTETDYWVDIMRKKLGKSVGFLRRMGWEARVVLTPPQRPLPGQTEAFPDLDPNTTAVH